MIPSTKRRNFRCQSAVFTRNLCHCRRNSTNCQQKVSILTQSVDIYVVFRSVPLYVFITTFTYLMFVRFAHYILPVNEVASHTNVIQLIITLRVSFCKFELRPCRQVMYESLMTSLYLIISTESSESMNNFWKWIKSYLRKSTGFEKFSSNFRMK